MKLSDGKLKRMKALANERGIIAAVAMDQRGNLQKALATGRGVAVTEINAEIMSEFKIAVSRILRMRLTAILDSLMISALISVTATPRPVASAFWRLPRWSMATAAMMPRSLASAFIRFSLPSESFIRHLLWHVLHNFTGLS